MFYGQFAESSEYVLDESVKITDVTFETLEKFVEYIYTGDLNLSNVNSIRDCLMELSYCAQKYMIDDLRKKCVERLTELLNHETVFNVLGKSFEMHLEDFLLSAIYYIVDSMEAGKSFNNVILSGRDWHLTSQSFEFLAKNLLDYLGERDDVLCLIKSWGFLQCQIENLFPKRESLEIILNKLNIGDILVEKILDMKAAFASSVSTRIPKSFHRVYYKPVRPLIIENHQMNFDVNVSFKRFVVVDSLMINSRLIPEQYDICDMMNNQTYVEDLSVEIFDKNCDKSFYKQHHIIENVAYNSFFKLKFNDKLILFPHCMYKIRLSWNLGAIGFEYPRCIYSLLEKGGEEKLDVTKNPLSIVQFHEFNYCYNAPFGSIVQGISYDLIS